MSAIQIQSLVLNLAKSGSYTVPTIIQRVLEKANSKPSEHLLLDVDVKSAMLSMIAVDEIQVDEENRVVVPEAGEVVLHLR